MDASYFSSIGKLLDPGTVDLAAMVASRPDNAFAALLAAADLVLLIDPDGRIQEVHIGSGDVGLTDVAGWPGQYWAETAVAGSQNQITALLAEPATPAWHDVNHAGSEGELPLKWMTLPLPDRRCLAIARDRRAAASLEQQLARAQQMNERDAIRLRQLEARQRLLFDTAAEPIFIIDAGTSATPTPSATRLRMVCCSWTSMCTRGAKPAAAHSASIAWRRFGDTSAGAAMNGLSARSASRKVRRPASGCVAGSAAQKGSEKILRCSMPGIRSIGNMTATSMRPSISCEGRSLGTTSRSCSETFGYALPKRRAMPGITL